MAGVPLAPCCSQQSRDAAPGTAGPPWKGTTARANPPASPWQEGARGALPFLWALELHGPRGDVEHGRVESLASEGGAFSIPALLQHLMDFLQIENRHRG